MNKTFAIRPDHLPAIEGLVAKLNRRAEKLSVDPIVLNVSPAELRPVEVRDNRCERGINGEILPRTIYLDFHTVTISLNIPKLAGWEFVATVQHVSEGANLLLTVPREENAPALDLSAFRSCPPRCVHCNLDRNRADTYVVLSESGELKQVGRQCLADFTGCGRTSEDAAKFAEWASMLNSLADYASSGESLNEMKEGFAPRVGCSLDLFLSHVVAVSNKTGFRTRKQADLLGTSSTREDAELNMEPPKTLPKHRLVEVTDEDRAFAKAAREWAAGLVAASDFDYNLKTIASADGLLYRNTGLAAYIVEGYRRHLGKLVEKSKEATSAHFGTVKERIKGLKLTYKGCASFDSAFGTTFIHRFITEQGNAAIWKTGTADGTSFEIGTVYTLDATVKKHSDYQGRAQTELTRVKAG